MRRPVRHEDSPIYEARTEDVVVRVIVSYLPHQSAPMEAQYTWAYQVEIENHRTDAVQLVSRCWTITDALNRTQVVQGAGVVGEQPLLKPMEAFRYTSGCPLPTASGSMKGHYQMITEAGVPFLAMIPEFSLHLPDAKRRMN